MIKKTKEGFSILLGDQVIIKHTKESPAFHIGKKKIQITMVNGVFDIEDQTTYKPLTDFVIVENGIDFPEMKVRIVTDSSGLMHLTFSETEDPVKVILQADELEKIFGMGEHFTSLNLRGHVVKNWVEEHITRKQIYSKIIRKFFGLKPKKWKFEDYKTYFIMPTFISSNHYFCDIDVSGYATIDFTNTSSHVVQTTETPREIVFGCAQNDLEVSGLLAKYKGIMPTLPDWIYDGMILAVQGGTKAVQSAIDQMLEKHAKINGVWSQDWCGELFTFFGKQVLWNWQENENLYPELKEHIKNWGERGVKFLTYINPYLNAEESMFQYAKEKDYLVKNQDQQPYLTKSTSFDFGIVDLTKPKAYLCFK